jgi:DNA mismatch repair protein PMS2
MLSMPVPKQLIVSLDFTRRDAALSSKELKFNFIIVRLFNQGLDIVEVSDDGYGVPIESRPYIAMKHATSKIREFDDIYSTDSLGFRGEALFCLANLSGNLVVATRTSNEIMGQKLEYTRDGLLRPDSCCAVPRKVGTTVAVVKIFEAVPVRRADLEKRINVQRREVFLMVQGCKFLKDAQDTLTVQLTTTY